MDGRPYLIGVGRWLDENALQLEEYAAITHANGIVAEPVAYSLDGVDPEQLLVMRAGPTDRDDLGTMGPYLVLWGATDGIPRSACRYADPSDVQVPKRCSADPISDS